MENKDNLALYKRRAYRERILTPDYIVEKYGDGWKWGDYRPSRHSKYCSGTLIDSYIDGAKKGTRVITLLCYRCRTAWLSGVAEGTANRQLYSVGGLMKGANEIYDIHVREKPND